MEELLKGKSIWNQSELIVHETLVLRMLSGWLQCVFLFGDDIEEGQLEKPPTTHLGPYMQKTCDVAEMAILAKKFCGKSA